VVESRHRIVEDRLRQIPVHREVVQPSDELRRAAGLAGGAEALGEVVDVLRIGAAQAPAPTDASSRSARKRRFQRRSTA
jgi:hypothetical protein